MTPADTDLISITEILQSIQAPVTITYLPTEPGMHRWRVEMSGYTSVLDNRLGTALVRCSTLWRAQVARVEATDASR